MRTQPKLLQMATIILLVAIFLTATSNATPDQAKMPYNEVSNVVIDGTISTNEYAGNYSETTTGMNIYWEHNGTVMYIGLESPGTGWVGIAFGPVGTVMEGANIIIGYVDDSTEALTLADNYGPQGWTHSSDTSLGGSDDIIDKAGSQSPSETIIEFAFPLDSGDSPYDYSLTGGSTFGFFVAYHAQNDDLTSYHSGRSDSLDFFIEPKPTAENQLPNASFNYTITELTVNFTDKSTDPDGTIVSWLWKFGDGTNSTEKNPSHTYSEMGTYAVSLTVTDDKEGTNTASKSLMVPSANQRMQLWITQVAIITVAIAFVSFTAVGIARKIQANKEGKKHGGHT